MFTGIVEEIGSLKEISIGSGLGNIEIECNKVLEETKIGDSIAVNGVCLTVNKINSNSFVADIMGETLDRTNLGRLKDGNKVNLERALKVSDRLGGHIVSGHVDGKGQVLSIDKKDDGTWFTISADKEILKYIILKGSITIDGISLTVAYVDNEIFKVSIIPHTLKNTILAQKIQGSYVNLENDIMGKYIEKFMIFSKTESENEKSKITLDFLRENGF
ncbi:riboflavin synthase [Clostridium butyricum]|jgi:riboflavin synthase|uniref:Riboflavin synthase n=2 Tax=root TaxID=1 RepID=A0A512THE9_CLOBU|nr:riboflavin synthase [Clostridium butyricum]ETI91400.1 MAG: Riboflavin synthase, alpha subunit [Clostridium butyricum DORA_1]EMU54098.1 riboflavin synthase, alpha subunit [Clostridium butyricum DKU-01]MBS5981924.1 riboflavin synthase [Clostridium butyricum]MDK2828934.1 riboflavin synthase [Clostridium butyricum]MDU1003789.1 riboflavin synthase [Clostridium butyricum]